MTRMLLVALGVGALMVASLGTARADQPCTFAEPYAQWNQVCTGFGNFCTIGLACTTVPGVQGTSNPNGYTPCATPGGCR